MSYSITLRTTGDCFARFQTQDGHENKLCVDQQTATAWLIENVRFHNGVMITADDIAIYEEEKTPVRLVKPARERRSLEQRFAASWQRISELEAQLAALTASASNPPKLT